MGRFKLLLMPEPTGTFSQRVLPDAFMREAAAQVGVRVPAGDVAEVLGGVVSGVFRIQLARYPIVHRAALIQARKFVRCSYSDAWGQCYRSADHDGGHDHAVYAA